MATNIVFEPVGTLSLPVATDAESGDAVVVFDKIPAVLLTDEGGGGNSDGYATCAIAPAYVADIPVVGENGAGNTAIAVGDYVYVDTDDEVNADATNGVAFGIALEAVASGATTTIRVLLLPALTPTA